MKIDVFEPISFCFGVENSIKMIKQAASIYSGRKLFCLGQPVHNEIISKELENIGINIINSPVTEYENVIRSLPNDCVLIFSAHGHDTSYDLICNQKNITIVDTICPIVKKVREDIIKSLENNQQIIYIGKKNHPESYAIAKISSLVNFWDISSSFLVDFQSFSATVYNQTTILKDKLNPIYNEITSKNPNIIIKNTSCKFVNDRYERLKTLKSDEYDYILILGSNTSSNTTELYEKAVELFGNKKALLVSKAEDIDFILNLEEKPQNIAIFSGTSAPQQLIEEITEILKQL